MANDYVKSWSLKIKQPVDYQLTIIVINLRFIANVFQSFWGYFHIGNCNFMIFIYLL